MLADRKGTKLECSDQEAFPSAAKNTGVVLVLCHTWKCVLLAISCGVDFFWSLGVILFDI